MANFGGQQQKFRRGDELPLNVEPAPEVSGVRGIVRPRTKRRHRMLRTASAFRALEPFTPGVDYEVMTNGEFSLLDAVLVLLERSGPADVAICTWSAGLYDSEVMNRFIETGNIRTFRLVLDVGFNKLAGKQDYAVTLMDVFGEEHIRTTRTHAKFVTISNETHAFSISSTANLNDNKRLELFYISDDPVRCRWFETVVDELFLDVKPGWNPDRGAPALKRVDPTSVPVAMAKGKIQMGRLGDG